MAQSSVEWLEAEFKKWAESRTPTFKQIITSIPDWMIKKAKAMHRKEHEDAYIEGSKCKYDGWVWNIEGMKEMADTHYNETFGKSE